MILISPVLGSSRPMTLAFCAVNHREPLWSKLSVCGSFTAGSGILYSVTSPVLGSSLPISPALLPVNQMLLSRSSARPCGPVRGVLSANSSNCSVFGSKRPSLLASWPVYQMEPSLPAIGSCGREPGVGTGHTLIFACCGPSLLAPAGRGRPGHAL